MWASKEMWKSRFRGWWAAMLYMWDQHRHNDEDFH